MASEVISLDDLLSQWGPMADSDFEPRAQYYSAIDAVLYLKEDVSYRADRIDPFLTLLWHPYEDRAVGVKLKGWKYLFHRLQAITRSTGNMLPDGHFVPLTAAFEVALTAGMGAEITAGAESMRNERKYNEARRMLADVTIDWSETDQAA